MKFLESKFVKGVKVDLYEVPGKNYLEVHFNFPNGFTKQWWRWDHNFDKRVDLFIALRLLTSK